MTQEQLGQLFQSFHQADSSTSRKYGGTGLGLAISLQLAELMQGTVEAKSVVNKGTTFTVTMKLRCSTRVEPEIAPADYPALSGLSVLVVEDNAVNQMVIWALLKKLDINVRMSSGGEDALDILAQHHDEIDMVLMDCEMPELDGYETTRRLREWESGVGGDRIPVIALTAHALADHRERCLASGMDDHLGKPVTIKKLTDKLEQWAPKKVR